ncbi:MAG: hypothetical protein AB7G12_10980 [Thermoanaerobaculia bacterium]
MKVFRSTEAGEAAYQVLDQAPGVYQFELFSPKLKKEQRSELLRTGRVSNVKTAQFVANHEGPNLVSGGTIQIDFSKVDRSSTRPYSGKHGDAAILAHETGHGVDYEQAPEKAKWIKDSQDPSIYENVREPEADKLRDAVVRELESRDGGGSRQ